MADPCHWPPGLGCPLLSSSLPPGAHMKSPQGQKKSPDTQGLSSLELTQYLLSPLISTVHHCQAHVGLGFWSQEPG